MRGMHHVPAKTAVDEKTIKIFIKSWWMIEGK